MKALVVYESLWGNTAAIARAIAEGIGDGATALSTAQTTSEALQGADLIVAGSPILGFALPTESMRDSIEKNPAHQGNPPDLAHPSMRTWLDGLKRGDRGMATFETRIWWSPGSSAKRIAKTLSSLGYRQMAAPERFIVEGQYGPLKEGELERAREWGMALAKTVTF